MEALEPTDCMFHKFAAPALPLLQGVDHASGAANTTINLDDWWDAWEQTAHSERIEVRLVYDCLIVRAAFFKAKFYKTIEIGSDKGGDPALFS